MMETYQSADGSTRCRACGLFLDKCMCGHERRVLTALGVVSPSLAPEASEHAEPVDLSEMPE